MLSFVGCLLLSSRLCGTTVHAKTVPSHGGLAFIFTGKSLHRRRSYTQGASLQRHQLSLATEPEVRGPAPPPHTALARVLANQYGVDLAAVVRAPGRDRAKLTAEDVEYHAWTLAMPPCAPDAAARAHAIGLDLNEIYDDDDRRYVLQLADVELFVEHASSLRMTSQTRRGADGDTATRSQQKRRNKMRALDESMGRKLGTLSGKALQFTGDLLQQAQLAQRNASALWRGGGVLLDKTAAGGEITAVGDFDAGLASEIRDALACVEASAETDGVGAAAAGNAVGASTIEGHATGARAAVADEEARTLRERAAVPTPAPAGAAVEEPAPGATRAELRAQTVVQLKERLRRRGRPVSGRKADLVERLLGGERRGEAGRARGGRDAGRGTPFFASRRGADDTV